MNDNAFAKLAAIDVSQHVEKKNNLSYLSWAWAVDHLMRADPTATWEFHEATRFGETLMVSCTVNAFGKPIRMHLPVMDHRNQAIKNPDAFQVNKNMMRCLVKAIACHGLGLYIYAGEDLPLDEDGSKPKPTPKPQTQTITPTKGAYDSLTPDMQTYVRDCESEILQMAIKQDFGAMVEYLDEIKLDADTKTALWSLLDSKVRSGIKREMEARKAAA